MTRFALFVALLGSVALSTSAFAFPVVSNERTGEPTLVRLVKPSPEEVALRKKQKACQKQFVKAKKKDKTVVRAEFMNECLGYSPPVDEEKQNKKKR